ncbi:MAG: DUF1800 domain-containing protein [Candidatus Eisenbacteria bacterium]
MTLLLIALLVGLSAGKAAADGSPGVAAGWVPHGWSPYTGAFGPEEAAHLLRRTVIGPRFSEIREAEAAGLESTLDRLFGRHEVDAPGDWVAEPFPDWWSLTPAQRDSVRQVMAGRQRVLRLWWCENIATGPLDLTETMTLFWHDHFATAMRDVQIPQSMYIQHALFRKHALGNFRAMLNAIVRDPAMLIWLDGRSNIASDPNENFARELFELFTMGEGSGYTQEDVSEAARAFTGWTTDGVDAWFASWAHDDGVKTILGETGNFGAADVVDILLRQPATSVLLAGKLYRWFLGSDPAPEDVAALAAELRAEDYEIAPVLRMLLSSDAFFDPAYRGSLVKSGADIYAGAVRAFEVENFEPGTYDIQARFVLAEMDEFGHVLFDPPDVAGWPGHLHWLNTQTLPKRKLYLDALLSGRYERTPLSMGIKVLEVADHFRDPNDPEQIVDDLSLLWFGQAPTDLVRQTMLETLLQGAEPYDWSIDLPDARKRLEDLFRFVVRLPEGQLK